MRKITYQSFQMIINKLFGEEEVKNAYTTKDDEYDYEVAYKLKNFKYTLQT